MEKERRLQEVKIRALEAKALERGDHGAAVRSERANAARPAPAHLPMNDWMPPLTVDDFGEEGGEAGPSGPSRVPAPWSAMRVSATRRARLQEHILRPSADAASGLPN